MLKFYCSFIFLLLVSWCSLAQDIGVDTIHFSLDKKLLIFQGQLNGQQTFFAFDTGAGLGLANSNNQKEANLLVKNSEKKIKDANLATIQLKNVVINHLTIGSHQFRKVKSVLYDMEYLTCNRLYLLGMDIIGQLNWVIDFEKNIIIVAPKPFPKPENTLEISIKYERNRPVVDLQIGTSNTKGLIDFGFTGILDLPENTFFNAIYHQKQLLGQAQLYLSSSMAVSGLGKADTVKKVWLDNVQLQGHTIAPLQATIHEKTDTKIGVGFLSRYCSKIILNHQAQSYYLALLPSPKPSSTEFDARVSIVQQKFVITARCISDISTGASLQINEEISRVDDKSVADFKDNCEFLNWFYLNNAKEYTIEKMNGEKLVIKRR